jgi:radical SAM protein with 4Fe4S-binding SPASM domain
MKEKELRFSPSLCITHDCNLNCVYCYQKHTRGKTMPLAIAKKSIDWIFDNVPSNMNSVEIDFIGGEPLLEFELIKKIVEYTCNKKINYNYIFFAITNGTVLTEEMKLWFSEHKERFWLGLSLDGKKETQDKNRSNSFDKIDFGYFLNNWPEQGVKMTLSEFSLHHLAENIKFIHSLGFRDIGGVNLFEGTFNWDDPKYIRALIPQLKELVSFYLENDTLSLNQMFDKNIHFCEVKNRERKKWCGIGNGTNFFDIDGKMYPCSFITPMTFSEGDIKDILTTDFNDDNNFIDEECFTSCYIYSICPTCSGANYMNNKTFKRRNRVKCKIQKLISLFIADLQAKRIKKHPKMYDDKTLYYTIEAIKKIRNLYLDEFKGFLE